MSAVTSGTQHKYKVSFKRLLMLTVAGFAIATANAASAYAADLPTGGQIVSGAGSITQSGNSMTINQNSNKLIANWNSFDIANGSTVNFVQPGASSVALNRISGGASQIFGGLNANGRVILINPNGIIFGKSSQVNVGGLVASALDTSDTDFLAGKSIFSGEGAGSVSNLGSITVPKGGSVALIAPRVANEGTINATGGSAVLAAGKGVKLDFNGDGLVNVAVTEAALNAEVKNKGVIVADGGVAVMTAKSANALLDSVVNNDGLVQANTLSKKGGRIILDGGDTGAVDIGGTLSAAGTQKGQKGGAISATGHQVNVNDGALVDASGMAGGGTIKIGGGVQGKDMSIKNAQGVTLSSTATITANATDKGNGGTVVAWSDGETIAAGTIQAQGGPRGGNGGFIETSGYALTIGKGLSVNAGAPKGEAGLWMLDPADLDIDGDAADAIVTGLLSAPVATTSAGGINVTADIISGTAHAFSLQAEGQINVGAVTISTAGGNIYLGGFTGGNTYATGQVDGEAGIVLNGSTINAGTGTITINGRGFTPDDVSGGGSMSATESAGYGVQFLNAVSLTGSEIAVSGIGGNGQDVESTQGVVGTVTCDGDFSCASEPANNNATVSGGSGAIGVIVGTGAAVTMTATTSAAIYAEGGNGGDASFSQPQTGGYSANGGSGAISYRQQTGGSMTFDAPVATIEAVATSSGGSSGSGYWYQSYESEPQADICDINGCTPQPDLMGNKIYFDSNNYGSGTPETSFYINGDLVNNHGTGSILNIISGRDAVQAGGVLTASNVMMEGGGGDSDFTFAQSGNAIDRLAAHDIDTLYFNHNNTGSQPLYIGTVSGVTGVTVSDSAYIQTQSTGNLGGTAALVFEANAVFHVDDNGVLTADTITFNNTAGSIDGDTIQIRPYTTSRHLVIGTTDPAAGDDLYIPTAKLTNFASTIDNLVFGVSNGTGNVTIADAAVSFPQNVSLVTGSGNITSAVDITVAASKTLHLYSGGTTNITGKITAPNLLLGGTGGVFNLDTATNSVQTFATTNSVGVVDFINTGNLAVNTASAERGSTVWSSASSGSYGAGITASNRVYVNTTGNLTMYENISGQGSYTGSPSYSAPANKNVQQAAAVLLVAGGNFHNPGSDSILTAANNRFLVYSHTPQNNGGANTGYDFKMYAFEFFNGDETDNGRNGYDHDNGLFGRTLPGSTAGDGFLYVMQPTLTVTPLAQSGTYGNTPSLSTVLDTGYELDGYIDGDDSDNNTGTPVFTTTATSASAVDDYDISYTQAAVGGLTGIVPKLNNVVLGYSVVNDTATDAYTVNQRPITIEANSGQGMIYGDAVPTLTYTVTSGSLVNTSGNGALSGALSVNATSASDAGAGYVISQGTLDNSNYDITYDDSNFTVNQRPITITANAGQTKVIGTSDPVFGYKSQYTGNAEKVVLVNGDTFTGALGRIEGEDVAQYDLLQGTLNIADGNGGNNYDVTFVTKPFMIIPATNTSSQTSAQNGITGTAVAGSLPPAASAGVGPGTGATSLTDAASQQPVTDTTTPGGTPAAQPPQNQPSGGSSLLPATGTTTVTVGGKPLTISHEGGTVTVGTVARNETLSVAKEGLPLFVEGKAGGSTYSVSEGASAVSTARVSSHAGDMPTYTSFSSPMTAFRITGADGASLPVSVGISSNGVLVIELPADAVGQVDPQATLALAWAKAKELFGDDLSGVTSAVIVPSSKN